MQYISLFDLKNVIEMTNKIPTSAAGQSDSIESANQVIQVQAIEQEVEKPTPCQTVVASSESRKQGLAQQDKTRPVYEPLRRTIQRYDDEPSTYQPLGLRNQSSTYQSLNTSGNESVM